MGSGEGGSEGQGGCEQRIKVFAKIKKIKFGGSGGRGGLGCGGQDGCDRKIEVFRKIDKKNWGGGVGGRVGGGGSGWL